MICIDANHWALAPMQTKLHMMRVLCYFEYIEVYMQKPHENHFNAGITSSFMKTKLKWFSCVFMYEMCGFRNFL